MENPKETQAVPAPVALQTDVDAFFKLLPDTVRSFATKHNEPKTVSDLSIHLARELVGQIVSMRMAQPTMWCRDEKPLALYSGDSIIPAQSGPLGAGALGNGRSRQGALVAQYPMTDIVKIPSL